MNKISISDVQRGRTWLPINYGNKEIKFAYPPVKGVHQECFQAINRDSELRPAEGLELALLAHGAYNGKEPEWQDIRQNYFVANYVRVPARLLWIPKNSFEDKSLSGVLVEKDLQGLGLTTKMQIPNLSNWKKNDSGLYVSPDGNQSFVREDECILGAHTTNSFAKDGFAIALLTPEGAEIYAETAEKAGKTPYTLGLNVDNMQTPEQRVALLDVGRGRLSLGGSYIGDRDDRAFGVRKTIENK